MTIFEQTREVVDITDAAQRYGLRFNQHGKALCPFHSEDTPSFSIKGKRWHCFGCGEGGDVIDLVTRLTGAARPLDAVKELNAAYHLGLDTGASIDAEATRNHARERDTVDAFNEWEQWACNVWAAYCRLLERWKAEHSPVSMEEKPDPRYVEACKKLDYAGCTFFEVFINGDFETKARFYASHANEVKQIAQYIRESSDT